MCNWLIAYVCWLSLYVYWESYISPLNANDLYLVFLVTHAHARKWIAFGADVHNQNIDSRLRCDAIVTPL